MSQRQLDVQHQEVIARNRAQRLAVAAQVEARAQAAKAAGRGRRSI